MTEVSLPGSLLQLENYIFAECKALKTVIMPDHRVRVGYSIFTGCDALQLLVVSNAHRMVGYRFDRWDVPSRTRVILHKQLIRS